MSVTHGIRKFYFGLGIGIAVVLLVLLSLYRGTELVGAIRVVCCSLIPLGVVFLASYSLRALCRISLRNQVWARDLSAAPISAWFGITIVVILVLLGIFAPILAPYSETEIVGPSFSSPSEIHLFGTDQVGRDVLSRVLFGARNTIGIALATTMLAFSLGSIAGMFAATIGGAVDQILSRIVDMFMAIPQLVFALLFLSICGTGLINMVLVISVLDSTRVFRLARAVTLGIVAMDYIEAAKLRGEGLWYLMLREILPNALAPLVAEFGVRLCFVLLMIAALSFLGLGIQPPTADWASMVAENKLLISFGVATPLIPGVFIVLLTVSINLVVDWKLHRASGLKD